MSDTDYDDQPMFVFRDDRPRDFHCDDFIYREPDPRPPWNSPYQPPERYPGQKAAEGQNLISAFLKRAQKAGDAHYAKVKRDLDAKKASGSSKRTNSKNPISQLRDVFNKKK